MKKVNYLWTSEWDTGLPDENFQPEVQTQELYDGYDFGDWLHDNAVEFMQDEDYYFVTYNGQMTGEVYKTLN